MEEEKDKPNNFVGMHGEVNLIFYVERRPRFRGKGHGCERARTAAYDNL